MLKKSFILPLTVFLIVLNVILLVSYIKLRSERSALRELTKVQKKQGSVSIPVGWQKFENKKVGIRFYLPPTIKNTDGSSDTKTVRFDTKGSLNRQMSDKYKYPLTIYNLSGEDASNLINKFRNDSLGETKRSSSVILKEEDIVVPSIFTSGTTYLAHAIILLPKEKENDLSAALASIMNVNLGNGKSYVVESWGNILWSNPFEDTLTIVSSFESI